MKTEALQALAQALHNVSGALRDKYNISDNVMERVVGETDRVISAIGDQHGSPAMVAALLCVAAGAVEGIADSMQTPEELPS